MTRTRDSEAGYKVTAWVGANPGQFTTAECAEGAGVATSTASGKLRAMLTMDPHLTLIRRGVYHYHGALPRPAGPPLKVGDVLEITGKADGRWMAADSDGNQWAVIAPKIVV